MNARAVLFTITVLGVGCQAPNIPSRYFVAGTGEGRDPVVAVNLTGHAPRCPQVAEWQVVTWPELDVLPVTSVGPDASTTEAGACDLTLDVTQPLVEEWYAVRYIGPPLADRDFMGGIPLGDGTRVFPFMGVEPPAMKWIAVSWLEPGVPGIARLVVGPSYGLEAASGREWADVVRVTQGELACTPPMEGRGLDVTCEGFDWTAPIDIAIDGLVSVFGTRLPVPDVEVTHVFGELPAGDAAVLLLEDGYTDPPLVPAELCAGVHCEP